MQLSEAIRARRMVRSYDPQRPVPRASLDRMLDAATRAPSAGFTQGWRFLVLDDAASRAAFWSATRLGEAEDAWLRRMRTAPALIVCFSDKTAYLDRYAEPDKGWIDRDEGRWPVPYWHLDTAMAAMLALLVAVDEGLGACWFGVPGERWPALRATFAVAESLTPIGVVSVGYPAADVRSPSLRRGRRSRAEVVSYGSFAPAD